MAVKESDIPSIAKESAAIYKKWKSLIDRYHGGMPKAMVAIRMKVESNGTMDMTLGSDTAIGLLSVTETQEARFGVPDKTRYTPEGNVFLACLRNNVDTALFMKKYPGLAKSFSDAYVFGGSLISSIGVGACDYLFKRSPKNVTFKQFSDWVQTASLPESGPWGSQSLDKIRYRVQAAWIMNEAGKVMESKYGVSNYASKPVIPPLPTNLPSFKMPKEAAFMGFAVAGSEDTLLLILTVALVAYVMS